MDPRPDGRACPRRRPPPSGRRTRDVRDDGHCQRSGGRSGRKHVAAPAGPIEIEAFDLGFKPSQLTVDAAGTYAVTFKNTGSIAHDLTFADGTKIAAEAGQTATGSVVVPAAGITFLCSIPGHADAGMKGTISVAGSTAGPAAIRRRQTTAARPP